MFRALDRHTGQKRWETSLAPGPGQYFFHSDALVTADAIVVGADSAAGGGIHALDRATGRQRWTFPVARGVMGPIAGDARRAIAMTAQGEIVCLDIASGAVRWRVPFAVPGWEAPALVGDRVFAGSADGALYALNANTGKEEWRVALGAPATTSVAATDSDLYVGTKNGMVHRIDARQHAVLGATKVDDKLVPTGVPVVDGSRLLVLLTDSAADYRVLVAVDRELNRVRWRQIARDKWSTSRVHVADRMALVGTPAGEVTGFCTVDGATGWSGTVRGTVRAIGSAREVLYVGTPSGTLYAMPLTRAC